MLSKIRLSKFLILYFLYVFLFAIILFFIQKPKIKSGKSQSKLNQKYRKNKDRVALIESGDDGFFVRLNMIENANKTIDISYYTLTEGVSVDIIFASIIKVADRGVKVRIILDGIFHNLRKEFKNVKYALAGHKNIELKFYEPFKLFVPRAWNNRLHDKMIIVDNELVLIGGRNIGDKYFHKESEYLQYSKDRDVILYNYNKDDNPLSSLHEIQNYFDKVYNYKYTEKTFNKLSKRQIQKGEISRLKLISKYDSFKLKYNNRLMPMNWHKKTQATNGVKFIYNPIARGNQYPWVMTTLLDLASRAKESVLIQSPYVILSKSMEEDFKDYHLDVSKIKILTNSVSSNPNLIGIAGYLNSKKSLIDRGITIYEYQGPQSIHGKSYIYDNKITAIGSYNFDARSSYINSEIMLLIDSENFASKINKYISEDLDNSLKVNSDLTYKGNSKIKPGPISKGKLFLVKVMARILYYVSYLL